MFSIFQKTTKPSKAAECAQSYIGLAARGYGEDYDLTPFILQQLDEDFKDEFQFNFAIANKKFSNFDEAMKFTSRRGSSKEGAFVIGLKCKVDEIDKYRAQGTLSNLIFSITNAITKKPIINGADLSKNADTTSLQTPRSPSAKVS